MSALARTVARLAGSRERRSIRARLGARFPARMRQRIAEATVDAETMLGEKATLCAAGALLGVIAGGTRTAFAIAILAVGGWRWPDFRLARASDTRRRAVLDALPDTLDVVSACLRAGSSIGAAFALAAKREPGPLGDAMRAAVLALERGLPKEVAYARLSAQADAPEVRLFVSSLRRAEMLGTSVAATIDALARDMRERRHAHAEERARGAPIRMLFPVVVCFLPAFVLLTIAPVLIVAVRGFRGA